MHDLNFQLLFKIRLFHPTPKQLPHSSIRKSSATHTFLSQSPQKPVKFLELSVSKSLNPCICFGFLSPIRFVSPKQHLSSFMLGISHLIVKDLTLVLSVILILSGKSSPSTHYFYRLICLSIPTILILTCLCSLILIV